MTEFFYCLDQIFTLFSYENKKKKKILTTFSSLCLRHMKVSNFTSSWVQYHTRKDSVDRRAVMSIQECLVLGFLYSSVDFHVQGNKTA